MTERKKTWAEIDAGKNKGGGRDDSSPAAKRRAQKDAAASASYKRDLDKLFDGGTNVPDRFKSLADKLKPEEGSPEALWHAELESLRVLDFRGFVTAASTFVKTGQRMPDDEQLLVRFLDHPSEIIIQKTLTHIIPILERHAWKKPEPLKNRISTLQLAAEDSKTHSLLAEIEKLLG